jgi:glycosyltransferase involved in cell wall biosynthesis
MNNRLLFIIHGLPMGGAEKFLITLLNYFSASHYESHLILLSNDNNLQSELNKQIRVYRILKNSRYDLFLVNKLRKVIQKINPSSIVCINTYAYFFTKLALFTNSKYRIVLSPHTTKPFSFYNYLQNIIYYRLVNERDTIIYLCNAQMNYLNARYHIGKHQKFIVYNGINTDYFNPKLVRVDEVANLKQQLGIQYSDKVIVQVARIQPEKRHEDAIRALQILNARFNNSVHLLLVGGGNDQRKNYLQKLVRGLSMNANVHFIDSQHDVRLFYKAADLFTLTSKSETFSLAALEAMAFGLPVVITEVGGAREMVTNYKNGFMVPVNNITALAHAWDKVLSLHFNGSAIRESVIKKFSLYQMQLRYKAIIEGREESIIF